MPGSPRRRRRIALLTASALAVAGVLAAALVRHGRVAGTIEFSATGAAAPVEQAMVRIEAGTFRMGAPASEPGVEPYELPAHEVTIPRAFWLDTTPVTNEAFLTFARDVHAHWPVWAEPGNRFHADTGRDRSYARLGDALDAPDHPAVGMTWYAAVAYANWRSDREGRPRCYEQRAGHRVAWDRDCTGYRLPTEAEWEYAARAGSTGAFPTGEPTARGCELDPVLDAIGWYCGNSGGRTQPVGRKQPNAWGLYDMHGLVWEWVWDLDYPYPDDRSASPRVDGDGAVRHPWYWPPTRVDRGGAFYDPIEECRSAKRGGIYPAGHDPGMGFRLARTAAGG